MTHSGRCYCGKINYEFEEPIYTQILCHCRECRYISGGEANASIVISENNFRVTKGTLKTYARGFRKTQNTLFLWRLWNTYMCKKSSKTWYVSFKSWNFK